MQGGNLEDTEKDLLAEVEKEIEKLKYYLEDSDVIIEEGDFIEIEVTHNRMTAIHDKLCNLIYSGQQLPFKNRALLYIFCIKNICIKTFFF